MLSQLSYAPVSSTGFTNNVLYNIIYLENMSTLFSKLLFIFLIITFLHFFVFGHRMLGFSSNSAFQVRTCGHNIDTLLPFYLLHWQSVKFHRQEGWSAHVLHVFCYMGRHSLLHIRPISQRKTIKALRQISSMDTSLCQHGRGDSRTFF